MATEVIVPKVDMVMETATFVEWLKPEGAPVEKGEPLFVIMTDKASIEIESPASGILAGVRAKPNDVLPVTAVIAYILEPGEAIPTQRDVHQAVSRLPASEGKPGDVAREAGTPAADSGKVRATPVARRLAAELGVDLASVPGSGPRGRVHRDDVLLFARQREDTRPSVTQKPSAPDVPLPQARQREVIPLAGARKIIAARMVHSAFTAPHITLSLSVDMTEVVRLRERVSESIERRTGKPLSFTAILARVVAAVLPDHPYLNASLKDDAIILWGDVHLGIATSVEDYLIVPVIREAQRKSLAQIAAELGDLLERGRARRLTPSEMTGSTFTISNLGMFGIESFTAIINPPESAILAVGKIMDTVVSLQDEVVVRPMMNLTLSADHRVVDGATGARFLADLKAALENPYVLV